MDSQRSVKPHVVGHVWTVDIPVALHFVDAVEGVDLLRPRVVDPVGEDELAEVDVECPGRGIAHDLDIDTVTAHTHESN